MKHLNKRCISTLSLGQGICDCCSCEDGSRPLLDRVKQHALHVVNDSTIFIRLNMFRECCDIVDNIETSIIREENK